MSERVLLGLIGVVIGLTFLGILVDFVFASRDAISAFFNRIRGKRVEKKNGVRARH